MLHTSRFSFSLLAFLAFFNFTLLVLVLGFENLHFTLLVLVLGFENPVLHASRSRFFKTVNSTSGYNF
jgi:hypothetical protein